MFLLLQEKAADHQEVINPDTQNMIPIKKIKWREGTPAPMKLVPYSALHLNGLIYVGGHRTKISTAYRIHVFDPVKDLWLSSFIKTPYCSFAMVGLHDKLVTVGGTTQVKWLTRIKCTNRILILDEASCEWKEYSQMSIPRSGATAVTHKEMLIVTDGWCHRSSKIFSSTEVLDTATGKWFSCGDLPQPHLCLQSAVVDNSLYLLGGANQDGSSPQVFTAPLDPLSRNHQLS